MNMMEPDVAGAPLHERPHPHIAGGFHSGAFISPAAAVFKNHSREIMLRVKKVGADGMRYKKRSKYTKQPPLESEEQPDDDRACHVDEQGKQGIEVFLGIAEEGSETHAPDKHGEITAQHGDGVADREVTEPLLPVHGLEFAFGDDGVRADVGAEKFGIVVMVIIMRAFPDAGRCEDIPAEDGHQDLREPAVVQDAMMLVVVIDDEGPDHDQAGKYAAADLADQGRHKECTGQCQE